MNVCVILARGGSKRLPGKNVMDFAGKPLIAHTIIAGLESGLFNEVVVSSDDEEILKTAKEYGAKTIKRPAELASDTATSVDALIHALNEMDKEYVNICLLQPTSPLRDAEDIRKAYKLFEATNPPSLFSGQEHGKPNGAIYFWNTESLRQNRKVIFDDSATYIMPAERSVDIDRQEDFDRALKYFKQQ